MVPARGAQTWSYEPFGQLAQMRTIDVLAGPTDDMTSPHPMFTSQGVKGNGRGTNMENQETYQRAKRRTEAKIGFYIHLAVYVGVNILLIIINLSISPQYIWFKWPLLGWGIGLFFHGMSVFVFSGKKLKEIKEKMIEKEMKRDSS